MAILTLTFHAGTVANISKHQSDWIVDAVNTTDIVISVDDIDGNGTISDDEWDAAVNGDGNDIGGVGYLFAGGGVSGTLYSTSGLEVFTVGQDVSDIHAGLSNNFEGDVSAVICFTPGTLITTPYGNRPVEFLRVGDQVLTADNGTQTIRWIGSKTISGTRLFVKPQLKPIKITRGALGRDLPKQDMWVSPQHRMHIKSHHASLLFGEAEVLMPAKSLVNGKTVFVDHSIQDVNYIHILFDQHELIFANGTFSESFFPGINALNSMGDPLQKEVLEVFPDLSQHPKSFGKLVRPCIKNFEARLLARELVKTAA